MRDFGFEKDKMTEGDIKISALMCGGGAKYARPSGKFATKIKILLALAGVLIGAVNGIFGAGGGMLAVPALSFIGKLDDRHSHATAIAVILPLCAIATIVYSIQGGFDFSVVLPTVLGVLAGGIIGALLLKKISNEFLTFFFYGIMFLAGLKMAI